MILWGTRTLPRPSDIQPDNTAPTHHLIHLHFSTLTGLHASNKSQSTTQLPPTISFSWTSNAANSRANSSFTNEAVPVSKPFRALATLEWLGLRMMGLGCREEATELTRLTSGGGVALPKRSRARLGDIDGLVDGPLIVFGGSMLVPVGVWAVRTQVV